MVYVNSSPVNHTDPIKLKSEEVVEMMVELVTLVIESDWLYVQFAKNQIGQTISEIFAVAAWL